MTIAASPTIATLWMASLGLAHRPGAIRQLLTAALVTLFFALLAYRWRTVDLSGAIAGAVLSFLLYATSGLGAFLTLAVVFLITAGSTRYGRTQKRLRGIAEKSRGRNAWQVLANLVAATAFSVFALYARRPEWLLAAVAALTEAAADTASSEIGKAEGDPVYRIISFRRVTVGADGGVSWLGTLAGITAAFMVAAVASWCQLISPHEIAIVAGAAVLGSIFDSLLGATLQQRGWLNNSAVNLASTVFAAALALAFQH